MQTAMTTPLKDKARETLRQSTHAVLMIRPHAFTPNPETAADNTYQCPIHGTKTTEEIARRAYDEVTTMVGQLEAKGITVHLFEDDGRNGTPDSVFPNNWITTHQSGLIGVHPMHAKNRRRERREDVLAFLTEAYTVTQIIDKSAEAIQGRYLEGTGVLILDRQNKVAYMARSKRTNDALLAQFCDEFIYTPLAFNACDTGGKPIYHTNVMMCLGSDFAIIGLECITNQDEREHVINMLKQTGKEIIDISQEQIAGFAGNALELCGKDGKILALSQSAYDALTPAQIERLEKYVAFVPIAIPTIEMAGGSVRCMLAEVFLPEARE